MSFTHPHTVNHFTGHPNLCYGCLSFALFACVWATDMRYVTTDFHFLSDFCISQIKILFKLLSLILFDITMCVFRCHWKYQKKIITKKNLKDRTNINSCLPIYPYWVVPSWIHMSIRRDILLGSAKPYQPPSLKIILKQNPFRFVWLNLP